jgi:hypothetical protein
MAEPPDSYNCHGCGDRVQGPPGTTTSRGGPVCEECVLRLMPSRNQLEVQWLRTVAPEFARRLKVA